MTKALASLFTASCLAGTLLVVMTPYSTAQTSPPVAVEHYEYLNAVIETLGRVQLAAKREKAVPPTETHGVIETLVAYAAASKLAAIDYGEAAGRLMAYMGHRDKGIKNSAEMLVATYRGLQEIETQAYDARTQVLRGNANPGDIRVRAAELRVAREFWFENMGLAMKAVLFAVYDLRLGGDPNAMLRVAITEPQRQQLLRSIKAILGEQVTAGPKEDQDAAVMAGAFLFQELGKVDPRAPKGK